MASDPELGPRSKNLDEPDHARSLGRGTGAFVDLGRGLVIGRAVLQPGWRWSKHVGPTVGAERCTVEHLGVVLSGHATAAFADGRVEHLTAGTLFHISAEPHDSWVVGDERYVSLHFLGAGAYAK